MARTHEEVDRRSLALHARVAARLRAQPSLIQVAWDNLERWQGRLAEGDPAMAAIHEWRVILESFSLDEVCELLEKKDEHADRLRQNSPFAGVLAPAEVWEIKRRFTGEQGSA